MVVFLLNGRRIPYTYVLLNVLFTLTGSNNLPRTNDTFAYPRKWENLNLLALNTYICDVQSSII